MAGKVRGNWKKKGRGNHDQECVRKNIFSKMKTTKKQTTRNKIF